LNKLIAHSLVMKDNKILIIKRSKVKRGLLNGNPEVWDIPGGMVEKNEVPQDAAKRETFEETNCAVSIKKIAYEFSEYDSEKDIVFTTLIYLCDLIDGDNIKLDEEEHTEYDWVDINKIINNENGRIFIKYLIPCIKALLNNN
jgi:8-oxo-dGTP diphosphatase